MNRPLLLVGFAVLLALTACSAANNTVESGSICERVGLTMDEALLPAELEAALDPVVQEGMAAIDAVGLTIAIQCAESAVMVKAYGNATAPDEPATVQTVYEIGSITKQFVAAEVLRLGQLDRLSLSDPIGMYLPWLPTSWRSAELEQLLSHTSGVPDHYAIFRNDPDTPFDWTRDYSAADLTEAFVALDAEMVAAPGSTFLYSSTGYIMLSAVIEQLTGVPLAVSMDEAFFDPLGLERTAMCSPTLPGLAEGYNIGPDGPEPGLDVPVSFLSGAAGICSTAGDLVRWERSLVDGTVIRLADFEAMRSPARLDTGNAVEYGLGLHLAELGARPAIFHEGGTASFSSWLAYYPDDDMIVAVLTNTLGPNSAAIGDLVVAITNAALDVRVPIDQ